MAKLTPIPAKARLVKNKITCRSCRVRLNIELQYAREARI
jgi:hypothetical protein